LTDTYDVNQIQAKYDRGFLYVMLPKLRQAHRVPVRVQTKEG